MDPDNIPFGIKTIERLALYSNCILAVYFLGSSIKMLIYYTAFVRYDPGMVSFEEEYFISSKFTMSIILMLIATLIIFYNLLIYRTHGFGLTMVTFVVCCVVSPLCFGTGVLGVYELWDMMRDPHFFEKYFSQNFSKTTMDFIQTELHCCGFHKPVTKDTVLTESCCVYSKSSVSQGHICTLVLAYKDECSSMLKRKMMSVYAWTNFTLIGTGCALAVIVLMYYMLAMAIKYYYYY